MVPERKVRKANPRSEIVASTPSTANSAPAFVFSRTFDASREEVWNALTQPEHLKHWWGTPGSSIEMWARFIFREITAPERLVWLNGFSDEHGGLTRNPWVATFPLETRNTVTLAEQDGKTQFTITVVPFNANDEEARVFSGGINGMKMGFGASFKVLADYLAQRS
jgi:uncharacterized protein YndB with AHSA1/START domain